MKGSSQICILLYYHANKTARFVARQKSMSQPFLVFVLSLNAMSPPFTAFIISKLQNHQNSSAPQVFTLHWELQDRHEPALGD